MSGAGQGRPAAIAAGFGEGGDWQEALGQVRSALAEAGGTATTGVVYVSDSVADRLPEIVEALTADTGITDWAGTVGMGVCGTGRAAFGRPAVAAAAFDFPQAAVRLVPGVREDAGEAGAGLANWAAGQARATALLHADPRNRSMGEIVGDLSEALGAFTVGGIASAEGPTAQLAGSVEEGVVSGLVFGEVGGGRFRPEPGLHAHRAAAYGHAIAQQPRARNRRRAGLRCALQRSRPRFRRAHP